MVNVIHQYLLSHIILIMNRHPDFNRMFAFQAIGEQVLTQLLKLDDWDLHGLTEQEFKSLFAKCGRCGLVTTARVHSRHVCASAAAANAGVIIDLTNDDEDVVIDLTDDDVGAVIDLTETADGYPVVIDLSLDD